MFTEKKKLNSSAWLLTLLPDFNTVQPAQLSTRNQSWLLYLLDTAPQMEVCYD